MYNIERHGYERRKHVYGLDFNQPQLFWKVKEKFTYHFNIPVNS